MVLILFFFDFLIEIYDYEIEFLIDFVIDLRIDF